MVKQMKVIVAIPTLKWTLFL